MPSRYFFGPSVKTNEVRASSARNFRHLIQLHLEGIIRLHYTREEYAALKTKEARLDAKDTTYLLACTYKTDESQRSIGNSAGLCNLIFLDIDQGGTAAPFVRSPDILKQKLEPFNFAAYTTASSTAAQPRMRLVVEADALPLASYPDAVRTVAARLGIGEGFDHVSLTPNQPMICPTLFRDQDEDLEHPLLPASEFKGRAFTVADIRTTTVSSKVAGPLPEAEGEEDGLEYLRAPLMGLTLEKVREALFSISADLPYPQWFDMAAALRHQFQDKAEEAYNLFDEWSATAGERYPGSASTLEQWNHIKPTPRGRIPVTIRTLVKRASEAGWSAGELKEECFDAVMDWIAHSATTRHDLTRVALEKIAGLPMLTATEEDLLLNAVKSQLHDTRKETITITSLRKDLKKIQSVKERSKDGAAQVQEKPCFKGWCYVTSKEEFFRPSSHQKMSGEAINSAFGRYLLPSEEQLVSSGKEVNEAALNTPLFSPKDYLLHHKQCLTVDSYDYDPANPKEIYTEDDYGVKRVNTYRASYAKPDPSKAAAAGKVILEHMGNLIKEPEYQRVFLDYIAYSVQFPGRKIRWCPLIQGAEGCGKTMMARLLEAVLGEDNVSFVNNDGIKSQWNDWAVGYQIVVIPEVYITGNGRKELMNKLKDLVTDDRIPINKRATSSRTSINRTNYLMFTNHHDALLVMTGSRRYFVIKSPLQTEQQVKALGKDYFERMFHMIANNAAGLRSFFESWDISNSFEADGWAPRTTYLEEMIEDSADEETSVFRRLVREGASRAVQSDLVIFGHLVTLLEMQGVRITEQAVAAMLRAENYVKLKPGARGFTLLPGEKRESLWVKAGVTFADPVATARQRLTNDETKEDWE